MCIRDSINTNTMECWTNLDKNCITSEDIEHIKSSWDCEEEKDECNLCFEELEQDYWLGTEAGQMGAYGFQRHPSGNRWVRK